MSSNVHSSCRRASQIGQITYDERTQLIATSIFAGVYEAAMDRESVYEILKGRAAEATGAKSNGDTLNSAADAAGSWGGLFGVGSSGRKDTMMKAAGKSAARTISSQVGRELIRDVLESLLKKK